jgi:hypothetical protein
MSRIATEAYVDARQFGIGVSSGNYSQLTQGANSSVNAGVLNQARAFQVVFAAPITVAELWANVAVAGAAGNVLRTAWYDDDAGALPGSLITDMGTMAADATGEKSITALSVALKVGKPYWFAYVCQGAGATPNLQSGLRPVFSSAHTSRNWTDQWWGAFSTTTITGAFPGTFPWAGALGAGSPSPPLFIVKAT